MQIPCISRLACAVLTLCVLSPAHAKSKRSASLPRATLSMRAEPASSQADLAVEMEAKLDPAPRASTIGTLAALVPGFALHGFGHWVAGDRQTAYKLFGWQLAGLGLAAASGLFVRLSGGSRYANEITIPMLMTGSGLFLNTFVADVYGMASGGIAQQYRAPARQAASLSYGYVHDPQFRYGHFAVASARLSVAGARLSPELWTALDADNQRARLPLAYILRGNDRGERIEIASAVTYHRFGDEDFSNLAAELSLAGRFEMQRLGKSLKGSFSSVSVGGGVQRTQYGIDGVASDIGALLLGHFGYGFYLPNGGEIEAYYEHRRDGFTAGLSPSERNGSGFLGHFGLHLRQPLSQRFALRAQGELGSAWLFTTGLEVRLGERHER